MCVKVEWRRQIVEEIMPAKGIKRGEIRNVNITGHIEVALSIACKVGFLNIKEKAEVIKTTLNPEL